MFQPQATPYSNVFSSYGTGLSGGNFQSFQPAGGGGGGVVDSDGPTVFRETVFGPVAASNLRGGGPLNYNNPSSNSHNNNNNNNNHNNHTLHNRHRQHYNKMAEHDLQAQTRAAESYERESRIEGPMVGEKRSSHAITEEYAKADPVYIAKTTALPQTYSHYRSIAGDGNCGWRAAGFSYFECLLRSQSRAHLEEEIARITSLNNILVTAGGFEPWLIEDMTDEMPNLLKDLAAIVETLPDTASAMLTDRFNDPMASPSIIYHLRLLASAWLASNADNYAGFIPDGLGVVGYRKTCLETVNTEIDHLGMSLLIDVLLKPIGVAVEIVVLDRTEGSQANSHILQSEDSNGLPTHPGGPMIHLLFRPSHYDILYREGAPVPDQQVIEEMAQSSNIQVNRAHGLSHEHHIQNTPSNIMTDSYMDLNVLLSIPGGYQLSQQPALTGYQSHYQSPTDQTYAHSPMSSSLSPTSPSTSIPTPSSSVMSPSFPSQQQTISQSQSIASPNVLRPSHIQSFPGPTTQIPIHTHTHMPAAPAITHRPSLSSNPSVEMPSPVSTTSSFRPSKYEYTATEWHEPVVFQTSSFKNSHFNPAHYNNPNFQPEEWNPDCDDQPARKKSSS